MSDAPSWHASYVENKHTRKGLIHSSGHYKSTLVVQARLHTLMEHSVVNPYTRETLYNYLVRRSSKQYCNGPLGMQHM